MIDLAHFYESLVLIAQAPEGNASGSPFTMLPAIIGIGFLFYFMMYRPEKRRQAEHKASIEALKKNDRVVTIGGIYGLVMNVDKAADEITLKVDEATNTKLRVTYGAISRIITDGPAGEKTGAEKTL